MTIFLFFFAGLCQLRSYGANFYIGHYAYANEPSWVTNAVPSTNYYCGDTTNSFDTVIKTADTNTDSMCNIYIIQDGGGAYNIKPICIHHDGLLSGMRENSSFFWPTIKLVEIYTDFTQGDIAPILANSTNGQELGSFGVANLKIDCNWSNINNKPTNMTLMGIKACTKSGGATNVSVKNLGASRDTSALVEVFGILIQAPSWTNSVLGIDSCYVYGPCIYNPDNIIAGITAFQITQNGYLTGDYPQACIKSNYATNVGIGFGGRSVCNLVCDGNTILDCQNGFNFDTGNANKVHIINNYIWNSTGGNPVGGSLNTPQMIAVHIEANQFYLKGGATGLIIGGANTTNISNINVESNVISAQYSTNSAIYGITLWTSATSRSGIKYLSNQVNYSNANQLGESPNYPEVTICYGNIDQNGSLPPGFFYRY